MQSIITMVESASIILLSVLAVAMIHNRFTHWPIRRSLLLGLLFALIGVAVMENSVEVIPGVRVDPRAAVVALSAAFGGPLSVALTAPALALLRLWYGGSGAVAGATYILSTGLVAGLAWYWWFRVARKRLEWSYILTQAAIAGTVPSVVLLFVSQAPWEVYLTANALFAPTNFVAAILMGAMVLRDLDGRAALVARQETQAQIDAIAKNAPAILFQLVQENDGDLNLTYVSDASKRILGIRPVDLMACRKAFYSLVGDAGVERLKEQLRTSREAGQPWRLELECARPDDGTVVWVRVDSGIRTDSTGRLVWEGAISDITERRKTEQMKDDFISTVSHELRTPLTSIRGSLGLVLGSASEHLPPKVLNMLGIANRNVERLVLLINDILDMQKIRSGQMTFSLRREPLRPMLEQALNTAQNYAPEKGIRFALVDDASYSALDVDPDRFNQVLSNLLSNAIKFSPKEGTVTLAARDMGGRICISVADEGPGIPEKFRSQIFNRFTQADTSSTRKIGGTGLGLNISKAITEAMHGTLSFESVEGEGSTFFVDLPCSGAHEKFPASNHSRGPRMPRILICSADPQLGQTVGLSIEHGISPTHLATDLETALSMLEIRAYAALVVDVDTLPSPELFHDLRGNPRTRKLPVILVSNEGSKESERILGAATEVVDWLKKPLDQGRLQEAILSALSTADHPSPRILYVEDDLCLQRIIKQNIGNAANVAGVRSIADAREQLAISEFDLVLLDLNLPDGSGLDLLTEFPAHIPVIIFSAFDVEPAVAERVVSVLTKSRVREADVARAVLAALPSPLPPPPEEAQVA